MGDVSRAVNGTARQKLLVRQPRADYPQNNPPSVPRPTRPGLRTRGRPPRRPSLATKERAVYAFRLILQESFRRARAVLAVGLLVLPGTAVAQRQQTAGVPNPLLLTVMPPGAKAGG